MRTDSPTPAPPASWEQLEAAIQRLHAAARSGATVRDFYRQLLAEATDALASAGAAAWRRRPDGRPELLARALADPADAELLNSPAHAALITSALATNEATIHPARSQSPGTKPQASNHDRILQPILDPSGPLPSASYSNSSGPLPSAGRAGEGGGTADGFPTVAVIELWLPTDSPPPVRQGWLDFAAALAEVAADFHAWDELRRLRGATTARRQTVDLLRRVQSPRDLQIAAFEAANEGRRLLGCQRLSVLIRRGAHWRLLATSGVDRVERSTDFARRSEELAREVARWGEAVDYFTQHQSGALADDDLPPHLQTAIEAHVDHSHARRLVAAPAAVSTDASSGPLSSASNSFSSGPLPSAGRAREGGAVRADVVLLAENFDSTPDPAFRDNVADLANLCAPALVRAAELNRFPIRTLLRWTDRTRSLREPRRGARAAAIAAAIAAAVAALALIPADFTVEAPATLVAAVERQVFATATGAVAEVRVAHGDMVRQGQTLIVLRDPELALKLQQVRGEIDATRKRLETIAVARTERTLREDQADQRLPLSAEQRELAERAASLELQRTLLEARRDDLEIKSPVAGQVLTRDVQSLLASRPVERGQVLLTIADSSTGWELRADVPQRKIGHVVAAREEQSEPLAADFRLAGDVARSYPGHVTKISAAAPLNAEGLHDDSAPVEVRVALTGDPPAAARSGMTAAVRIHCGRRSLAYLWLHDPAAAIYRWFTF